MSIVQKIKVLLIMCKRRLERSPATSAAAAATACRRPVLLLEPLPPLFRRRILRMRWLGLRRTRPQPTTWASLR